MNFYIKRLRPLNRGMAKLLLVMKLIVILLTTFIMQVSATGFAQKLTYSQKNVTLKQVFNEVRKQTGYDVIWPQGSVRSSTRIDVEFKNSALDEVLNFCFQGKPLEYSIEEKTIVVKEKKAGFFEKIRAVFAGIEIRGKVVDKNGEPLVGATVAVKGGKVAVTNKEGEFFLNNVDDKAIIVVSYIGYIPRTFSAGSNLSIIRLELGDSKLDEVQVMAYGTTSKRLGTGNITTISGEDISKAPIANPIAALEGRVPGMIVNQTNGAPGSAVKIQIRGRTRIDGVYGADETPLFIIDGVPMASGNSNLNLLSSAISANSVSGLSPFSTINAGDIESIEVLKDADATAIYGSRGASGVVLITTKKGKAGNTRIELKAITGISKAQLPDLLNTKEYVAMRKEAFKNDNITMTNANAYDLLVWDTTRNDNLAKQLIGGSAAYSTFEGRISGGSELVTYSAGGSYYRETNVYPKPVPNTRSNGHISISSTSANRKFTADFRGTYAYSNNQAPGSDLSMKLTLAPNYKLYNEDGSLAWNEGGIVSDNPLAYMLQTYSAKNTNLNANLMLGYKLSKDLTFRTSIGYNNIKTDEIRNTPKASINPTKPDRGFSSFGNSNFNSWIIEPQLHYTKEIAKGKLTVLAGGTIQSQANDSRNFTVRDYPSDDFLGTLIGISSSSFINTSSSDSEYKYAAYFGRVSYDYNSTYIVNISGRRDGSSRFGPNYKYSTFGAIGAAWVFTNESFVSEITKDVLSFGKLRASYGTTGNDKIGDYKYIDLYGSQIWGPTYSDSLALSPTSLFKPDLHWEKNRKLEVALDMGFMKDRFVVTAAWYRNRSNDPLVQYPLPIGTGFSSVVANLNDVVVQNQGVELTLDSRNIQSKNFEWRTSFNITIPENKLVKYPGLENSSYAKNYVIGKNLDLVYIGNFVGVDPKTGLYKVADLNGNGTFNITNLNGDLSADFDSEPAFYGGFQNSFRYKNFSLSIFMNFNKQWTRNWRTIPASNSVGSVGWGGSVGAGNVPRYVLRRWQNEGDITDVQKFTTKAFASTSLEGSYAVSASDALYENIFYARLRTVELMYMLPSDFTKRLKITGANFFLQGQNLFTFSPFRGTDPQTVFITSLAPLRTFVAGVQLSF